MKLTKNQSHENVAFMDGDDPFVMGYQTSVDSTRQDQDAEIATLAQFLSRPIKIADIAWGSVSPGLQLNVWQFFFENPRVANRLTNYNLLRCTLKVKFVVNGNPFYFGRMMVSYVPFISSDSMSAWNLPEDRVQLSQLPHILLNPTTSTGGILTCPFFYNKNYAKIPTSEINDLGYCYLRVLASLFHTNDADFEPVNISVFAWAEDVQMSVLTSRDTETLEPQAGEIETANASGIVSGPASTVARIANALGKIPYISPYAKATELAASTVSTIASSFGYCRPSITKSPDFVKILPSSSFALTNTPDNSLKLSVDHKQEATVDPRIAGIEEEDMLSIVNIAKRESFITSFSWNGADQPGETLFNMRVTPVVWNESETPLAYHFPATAMAALPFRFWTGTLNYRFLIAASGFHKGRLAINWDPNFVAASPPEFNTMYTEIVDLAETNDFTVTISNGQPYTMIRNTIPGVTSLSEVISQTRYTSFEDFSNGVVHVSVLNTLTTPNPVIEPVVTVSVFISAGDDFKVFVPWDHFQSFVPTPPVVPALLAETEELEEQSGDLLQPNQMQDSPEGSNEDTMYDAKSSDYTNLVYTGEAIPSFRAMVKRYSLWRTIIPTLSGSLINCAANWKFAIYPFQRGRYGNAPDLAVGGVNYAFCNTLLLHWVTYAFAGFRGNFRYKVVPRGMLNWGGASSAWSVQRFSAEVLNTEYASAYRYTQGPVTNTAVAARTAIRVQPDNHLLDSSNTGTQGMAWVDINSSGMLEFEVPFYSQFRFAGTRHLGWTQADTWGLGGYYLQFRGATNNAQLYDVYAAAGEDFQTYFFIGLPRMYYEPTPPASA